MQQEYNDILQKCREALAPLIAEADMNPDKWYEIFVTHNDESTETIDNADTFAEATVRFPEHCELYGAKNLSIDIWHNRNDPEPINNNNPNLHQSKECQNYPSQIITMTYYGHEIEVTITPTPYCKLEFVPDSVKKVIFESLESDSTEGEFTDEDAEEYVDEDTYCTFSGSWRIIQLHQNFLARVCLWVNNYADGEGLTRKLFAETYGKVMGDHYAIKWESVYKHNIMAMINYFGYGSKDGQLFCDMIIKQMTKYEQRVNRRRLC